MSHINIRRRHKLSQAVLHKRMSHLAEQLAARYGADCSWDGEMINIDHSNVSGTVRVGRNEVVIDAQLGFFLSMFQHRVEEEIARLLDRELEGTA